MSTELTVTEVGDELAIIIPKAMAAELHIQKGDTLFLSRSKEEQAHYSSEKVRRQMEVARRVMRENQNLLHRLAQ